MNTLKLLLQVAFNLTVLWLFLFGIVSPIVGIANVALFTAWVIAMLTLLIIIIGDSDSSREAWDVLKGRPVWYKIIVSIVSTAATLALVFNGHFILGAILIVGDFVQLSKMWKLDAKY